MSAAVVAIVFSTVITVRGRLSRVSKYGRVQKSLANCDVEIVSRRMTRAVAQRMASQLGVPFHVK